MMPHIHESSAWSTGTRAERGILLLAGVLSTAAAVTLFVVGHRSACFAVLAIAAIALVGFVFTALQDDSDVLLATDDAAVGPNDA